MKTTVIGNEKQNGAVKNTSTTDKSAIRPSVAFNEQEKEKTAEKLKVDDVVM